MKIATVLHMKPAGQAQNIGLAAVLIGLSACSILEVDTFEKTLPDAYDLQQITLIDLQETAAVPDSYNVEVFVVGINVCPENARCAIADGITISEAKDPDLPDEGLHIAVSQPQQFERKKRYVLSMLVEAAGWEHPITGKPVRHMRLLGYSRIR